MRQRCMPHCARCMASLPRRSLRSATMTGAASVAVTSHPNAIAVPRPPSKQALARASGRKLRVGATNGRVRVPRVARWHASHGIRTDEASPHAVASSEGTEVGRWSRGPQLGGPARRRTHRLPTRDGSPKALCVARSVASGVIVEVDPSRAPIDRPLPQPVSPTTQHARRVAPAVPLAAAM